MVVTNDNIEMTEEDNIVFYHTLACMEYKHKSEAATVQESRNIVSTVLGNFKVTILPLARMMTSSAKQFPISIIGAK